MAGGIDWFRWHHGSVTDPKFQLVARKAGVRLGDVLGVWAFLLEKASASSDRGCFGELDEEAMDLLFGLDDGQTAEILRQMEARGLVGQQRVGAWEKRQPKREREDDATATERKRRQRARDADADAENDGVTDECHDTSRHVTPESRQVTPRGEERREEGNTPPTSSGPPSAAAEVADRPLRVSDLEAEGVPKQAASDWLKVRRAKKAPLTLTAWEAVKREADACGLSPAEAVQFAAEAGWQGFKASWWQKAQHESGGSASESSGSPLMAGAI